MTSAPTRQVSSGRLLLYGLLCICFLCLRDNLVKMQRVGFDEPSSDLILPRNERSSLEESPSIKELPSDGKEKAQAQAQTQAQAQAPQRPQNVTIPDDLVNKTRFFVLARPDRSGAAILDYLKGLSMALEFGLEFGGVCGETHMVDTHKDMIEALGLDTLIKFRSCPNNRTTDFLTNTRHKIYNRGIAGSFSSPEVLNYIRSVSHARRKPKANTSGRPQVGVHIRRGDVNPCGYYVRYLPNEFYLKLVEMYAPPNAHVTIFSEQESHENWTDFANFTLSLEGNITDVWRSMLESDVFILSRSSFSVVPAIVSSRIRTAVYLPYSRNDPKPLPEWKVVNANMLKEGMRLTGKLRKKCSESEIFQAKEIMNPEITQDRKKNLDPLGGAKFEWPENA
mmetsp:Transcript_14073/g.23348  ORF Transcript_14073/g.23348 Transcript_14073/m.23348 type:complete len:394 (+) Transcript_14073:49-1230(+)